MSLGTLTVDILMKTGKFETDTKRAECRAAQMAKNIDKSISAVGTALASAAAVGFAAFAVGIKSAVDAADEMGKVAQKIGVTVESLSALSFAASQSEVDVGQLQKALAKVSVDLVQNNSDLKALGITATTSDQALVQLSDIFASMPDGLQKTALAAKLFGERIGPDLIPLLNLGSRGINDLKARAEELGIVISSEMARDADAFNDSMDEVKAAMQGAFLKLAQDLLPEMKGFANYMASPDFVGKIKSGANTMLTLATASLKVLESIVDVAEYWGNFAGEIVSGSTAGASGNKKYIESRIDILKDPLNIGADFSNFNGKNLLNESTAKKLREFQALLAEVNEQEAYAKIDFSNFEPPSISRTPRSSNAAIDALLNPPKKTGSNSSKAAAEAARAKAEADRAAEEAARALADTNENLNRILENQSAEMGGPIVQAAQDYTRSMLDIISAESELVRLGKLDEEATIKLNLARENALELYQKEVEAIQGKKTPAEEELERLRNELELLGLTNEERAKRAFLLNNPGASDAQAEQAAGLVQAIDQAARAQQAMDQFRSSAEDAFAGFLTGSMSAKDAFESFADSVVQQIARILAQQAIESLFGGFGGAGGGSFGGSIGSFFGSLFGGGRASGGAVQGNRLYRVNENGPEMLSYQGKDFLMMGGGAGMVRPNAGGSNITVNVSPMTERRTALQIASRVAEKQRLALARNG
jgi:predicted transcriptional regulator